MGLGGLNKIKVFVMAGLSLLAVGVTSISTFAWFQINNSLSPSTTVQTNGMRTDAFVYQDANGHSYDDAANKSPTTDAAGTLTYDHSQGQAATSYYIMGNGSLWDGDFTAASGLQMYKNPNNPNDRGTYWKIHLAQGDTFKIFNSEGSYNVASYWFGYSSISSSCTLKGTNFTDSNTNIYVAIAGVYDIFISIQNIIFIQYHSDTRFAADTTNEIGYLIVGSGSDWTGNYDMGEGIPMTINKRSDSGIDKAMYAGLRLASGDSFRVVDGSSSQDDPTYYETDDSASNLAPRTSGASATSYFSYSATSGNYTFTCLKTAYYCIYLNASSHVNIQLWDGRATDGSTYYTRGQTTIGSPQASSRKPSDRVLGPKKTIPSGDPFYLKLNNDWAAATANYAAYLFDKSYLYLDAGKWNSEGSPRYAVYSYGSGGDDWADMEFVSGNLFRVKKSDVTYISGGLIFCRMNPSSSANNWNNKWNQTGDLTLPNDGKNKCSITANTIGDNPSLSWSEETPNEWVRLSSIGNNYFSGTMPNYEYTKVTFVRLNPGQDSGSGTPDWGNAWNQTGDMDMPGSESSNNLFTVGSQGGDGKYGGTWSVMPAPVTLTFQITGDVGAGSTPLQIAAGGSITVPSFTNSYYGYTKPTSWSNGTVTLSPGDSVSYDTASSYSPKTFTASYAAASSSTFYLDLYSLKFNNVSGFSNSPSFSIYAWDASGNKDYGAYGSAGFPAQPITTNVVQNVDSSAAGYDANAHFDYRNCFWRVDLPSTVTGYLIYVGASIGTEGKWQTNNIGVSKNLAIVSSDKSVSYVANCTGNVRKVTTVKYVDSTETTLYKYNVFDKVSWTVPSGSSETGHTFTKWYSNKTGSGGTQYDEGGSYAIESDITMYALYSVNSYTLSKVIKIYRNGSYKEDGATTNQSLPYNTATSVTSVSRTGATFVGWYSDPNCGNESLITNSASFNYTIGAAPATIYAKFNLNSYNWSLNYKYYDADTLDSSDSGTQTFFYDDSVAPGDLTKKAKAGYFFDNWYSNSGLSNVYTTSTVTGTKTLYAKYSKAKVYLYGSSSSLGSWDYTASSYSDSAASTVTFSGVTLDKGDQIKGYSPNGNNGQPAFPYDSTSAQSVSGSALTNGFVDINSSDQHNIRAQFKGTYDFTLSVDENYNITALSIVATALDPTNFVLDFASGSNPAARSDTSFSASGNAFTVTFHAFIGDQFRFKKDFYTSADVYLTPTITAAGGGDFAGLQTNVGTGFVRANIDADITLTFTANLSSFGSSTCAVTRVQEYSIVYAAGEHAEFDTATYFIQAADDSSFTQGVSFVTMHYPVDPTNYHAVYTGYTLSFSESHNHRYVRVLQRLSNVSGSSDGDYQHVFIPGQSMPTGICSVSGRTYDFTSECVLDIRVHKAVSDEAYLEIELSQATSQAASTHYSDIYLIGRGKPGSDIRDGDYTTDHGIRMHTYGGNTTNFPAYIGDVDYNSSTFATAAAARTVGSAITLMAGDNFILTDGVTTFGPSSSGTGYSVSSGTVTITQSAEYYVWATATNAVQVAQKQNSVISDGRTSEDRSIDSGEDWYYAPVSYNREYGARVLNASGRSLNFGGKLDYSLLDGCGDGYYHFYVELRNITTSTSGSVTYGFSNLSLPTGTQVKYANATQNTGSTLKSGFNSTTLANLGSAAALTTSTVITNSEVTANVNGFAGSTVIEVMIPISQIASAATFDFAFTVTVNYQETISS